MPELPITSPDVPPPPTPQDERRTVERKLSRARARLFARIDELGKRVGKARDAMDVAQIIRDHPLPAAGIAFAAGLLAGIPRGKGRIHGEFAGLITGIAAQAVRASLTGWMLSQFRGTGSGAGAGD